MNSVVVEVTTLIQKHHSNGFEVGRVVVTPELTTAHQQERQFLHQSTVKLSNHGNHRGVEVMKHKFMTVTNTHIFMHQSRRGVSAGDKVHQGEILGKVGSTGNSSGPHLHWQVNKGKGYLNNHPDSIDPLKWVKEAAKAGGGGVNKSAAAWKPDIRRAAKAIGVRVSSADVNDVARLIQTESSGNGRYSTNSRCEQWR